MWNLRTTPFLRLVVAVWAFALTGPSAQAFPGRTCSSPIALTSDDRFVWVVNPDTNTVSLLEVGGAVNQKVTEFIVGAEPQSLALTPDDSKLYVTNAVAGSVSVVSTTARRVVRVIPVGTEPFGCALTPDGSKLYVANFPSDNVSVINTATDTVISTIAVPATNPKPRGVAITPGGKVYVTSFLAQLRPVGGVEGRDNG